MSYVEIPLSNDPFSEQSFKVTLADGNNVHILLKLAYHDLYGVWLADIYDASTNTQLISALPMVCGENILKQFGYLGIGDAYIVKAEPSSLQHPDNKTLGSTFILVWGDGS